MKSKLSLILIIAAMATLLFACGAAAKQVSVEVSCDEFMQQQHISEKAEMAVGDSLIVTLCSNPSTGFQWSEMAQISDQTVLEQLGHEFIPPEKAGVVGAAGQEVWIFEALKKGTSVISMEYSRPWEGGEEGEWTFNLTVVVK